MNMICKHEKAQCQSTQSRSELGKYQQASSVYVIGKHAASQCQEQSGRRGHEAIQTQPKRRLGEAIHQQALGDGLHPGSDIRKKSSEPEESIVAMTQRAEHS